MFLFDEKRAEQLHYRTVMINWLLHSNGKDILRFVGVRLRFVGVRLMFLGVYPYLSWVSHNLQYCCILGNTWHND